MIHTLTRDQRLPGTPEQVFPFFADAANLEAITPPWLRFRILTPQPIVMRPSALIEYKLSLRSLPVRLDQPIVEPLCQEFRVVTIDSRGTGASDPLAKRRAARQNALFEMPLEKCTSMPST